MTIEHVAESVETIVVQRRRQYGHDRAYVSVLGEEVGYRDLKTGSVQCTDARHLGVVVSATEHLLRIAPSYTPRHARDDDAPVPTMPAPPRREPEPEPASVLAPDRDLALAEGEEVAVARRLVKLRSGWQVLHAVPIGNDLVDHLIVGPPGVFTVSAKYLPDASVWVRGDTVKVDGHHHRFVRDSRRDARAAERLLAARIDFEVPVRGVIVVVGARKGFGVKEQPADGTVVLPLRALISYLRGCPSALDAEDVESVYGIARHLATWQPDVVGWSDF